MIEPQSAKDRIIVALDVPEEAAALDLVRRLTGAVGLFKIGLELFTAAGPSVVARVRDAAGGRAGIFLDLKLHDIPNTVAGAVRAAARLGVDMLTVHLSGGGAMLAAAQAAAGSELLLLGVSVLTSSTPDTQRETGADADIPAQVRRLVTLGEAHGLTGFVASPHELKTLRQTWPDRHTFVIPGVRPAWSARAAGDDQRRVLSPAQAMACGADYLVIGRPITRHDDPPLAAEWVVNEMAGTII